MQVGLSTLTPTQRVDKDTFERQGTMSTVRDHVEVHMCAGSSMNGTDAVCQPGPVHMHDSADEAAPICVATYA